MIAWMLVGCGGVESTGAWSEGVGFDWELFNHRLSHLQLGADDEGAYAAVVGGTSTTNAFEPLAEGCDPDTCDEFPFLDFANVRIGRASATTDRAVFGAGAADLVVGADGGSASVVVELPSRAKGSPVAVIRGFTLNTDQPLAGGEACYRPKNGWIPRGMGLALGEPALAEDGRSVSVEVSARFDAGPSLEAERACLDAVIDEARVAFRVELLVAVGRDEARSVPVSASASYGYGTRANPEEQPPPSSTAIDGDLGSSLVGWSAWDFRFHERDARGAYLRVVDLPIDAGAGEANGVASNYSPGTQLSAFDYAFEGTVQVLELGVPVERVPVGEQLEVALDAEGRPVVSRW